MEQPHDTINSIISDIGIFFLSLKQSGNDPCVIIRLTTSLGLNLISDLTTCLFFFILHGLNLEG